MTTLEALALILAAAVVTRWWAPAAVATRAERVLESPWIPVLIGIVSAAVASWVWGSLDPVAIVHDEAAYLLQAKIYAGFHWTAPARPLSPFFEQYHVFVTPWLLPKYPPGHAMAMVPGIWLGLPTLMPTLCIGATGSLLYLLARRVSNVYVALLAWLFWLTAPGVLFFLPTYMSESTSAALWLLGWWALLEWRDTGAREWLLLLAACVGWGAITRPLSWLLFAIPVAVVVLPRLVRRRAWSDLGWATLVGLGALAILVLWCLHTTGRPFETPYALYSRVYFPSDVMGFGASNAAPLRHLPEDMQHFNAWVVASHSEYTLARLPANLLARLETIASDMWGTWRVAIVPFALIGLTAMSAELAFALASALVLVLGYLSFGHGPAWSVYYLEIQPVLAFVSALGIWQAIRFVEGATLNLRRTLAAPPSPRPMVGALLVAVLLLPGFAATVQRQRRDKAAWGGYHTAFRNAVRHLVGDRIIVFVRYAPDHSPHMSLITNEPDLDRARVWTVYDYGPEDMRLIRLAPQRIPYLFDETKHLIVRIDTTQLAAELAARDSARAHDVAHAGSAAR
ncbi:MAG: glycosyltransferase family 39 protein [Gemmatimonadaceae bacterium]|nr:glycosyltransferase family 39 protein [Gemmatimonadaceae bacterium]